jgi:hypothetical protein
MMTDHERFGEPRQPQVPQGQQGYWQPPFPPQQPPRHKSWPARHKVLTGFLAFGAIVLIGGIASAAGSSRSSPSTLAVQTTPPTLPGSVGTHPATHPATEQASRPVASTSHVVATFSGSGIENTRKFTVTSTWKLDYSFNCQNFGSSGNFIVTEDGGSDFSGVDLNDLAVTKTGSTWAYHDSGTHYLEINSECDWTVKVTDEG